MIKILTAIIILSTSNAYAQAENFYEDILIPEEVRQQDEQKLKIESERSKVQSQAGKLLDSKPNVLKIDTPDIKVSTSSQVKTPAKKTVDYGEAPLGLSWGVSMKDVRAQGVVLRPITNNYKNTFEASLLPKPVSELKTTIITFGEEDKLWRIIGYSEPSYDDANASKGLRLYNKYAALLELKYGNYKEVFTPAVRSNEVAGVDQNGKPTTQIVEVQSQIGDKHFLEDLKSEKAFLYSTFDDGTVGVSLTLQVDEEDKSYIIIEYRNSKIIEEQYNKTLNAL